MQQFDLLITNIQECEMLNQKLSVVKTTIDISPLPGGVYAVKVTGETTKGVGKFVKLYVL